MSHSFESLGLSSNIINGCKLNGFDHPYTFHRETIPSILSGRDVVAVAPSCSARALCFVAPILDKLNSQQSLNSIRALILTPTKYLALQILKLARLLCQFTGLRIGLLVGDNEIESLYEELTLQNPDVMIATPENLTSHLSHVKNMLLHNVECIVFDEANSLLSMGFARHLRQILPHIRQNHQTLVFTDAVPSVIDDFIKSVTQRPHVVHHFSWISSTLKLIFFTLTEDEKKEALLYLIRERIGCEKRTLIFVPTRYHAEFLNLLFLEQGIEPSVCYGDMSQKEKRVQVSRFRTRKNMLLITTDMASNVMDIPSVDNVINWDFPISPKHFLSRLRVTARAGRPGTAFSFVTPEDISYVLRFRIFLLQEMVAAPSEKHIMQDGNMLEVVSEIDQTNMSEGRIIYGRLPQIVVDCYADSVRKMLDNSPKLKLMETSCAVASDRQKTFRADLTEETA
ncbi:putative DEAD-box ATP-dependent RNA helicase 29 [Apium graveolens]|uniref:putative DEAD-box ATP-dependent RNA helicase 29 n=1 Tax=Apium graveolens TaxID=4045 RepID=UPI003D792184